MLHTYCSWLTREDCLGLLWACFICHVFNIKTIALQSSYFESNYWSWCSLHVDRNNRCCKRGCLSSSVCLLLLIVDLFHYSRLVSVWVSSYSTGLTFGSLDPYDLRQNRDWDHIYLQIWPYYSWSHHHRDSNHIDFASLWSWIWATWLTIWGYSSHQVSWRQLNFIFLTDLNPYCFAMSLIQYFTIIWSN